MARLETKIIQLKKQNSDLKQTILDSILQEEKDAREKNIEIRLSTVKSVYALHDKNWLGEAIGNLLDNSIKYSGPGSQIRISLLQNEMFAQIRVRDFGIGIEPGEEHEILSRLSIDRRVTKAQTRSFLRPVIAPVWNLQGKTDAVLIDFMSNQFVKNRGYRNFGILFMWNVCCKLSLR